MQTHVDIYTFKGNYRFSFKELENQRALGLLDLMPDPRFKLRSFDDSTGVLLFNLGREGTVLSNSDGVLEPGIEMRATQSGPSLGIELVTGQKLQRVPVMKHNALLKFVMPRNFYNLKADSLFAQTGVPA